jgi:outer membrane protein OmpA-like peptidoglycan-associated protein
MKYTLLLFLLLLSNLLLSQTDLESSDAISDCTGAVTILKTGNYRMQFSGKGGKDNDFGVYSSLKNIPDNNTLFCSFKAPFNGRFTLNAKSTAKFRMIIFEGESMYPCEELNKGAAEIKRIISKPFFEIGLNLVVSENTLYPLDLSAGKEIIICFIADSKVKDFLEVSFHLEPINHTLQETSEGGKLLDLRTGENESSLTILVRDYETGKPVIANVTIIGIKQLTASYQGSDFRFTPLTSGKVLIKVDAIGYFFIDREEPVSAHTENEIVIWLEPLGEGKSMQIDEIEFSPGTSEFLVAAETKLRRLKDFLALNAGVNIEIQGHVHSNGENTFDGQKLSEARAKRVCQYLVDSGINKSRLTTMGFGNTKPLFPNARFASEEQANRRVEIKVL